MTTTHTEYQLTDWIHTYANDPQAVAEGMAIDVTDECLAALATRGLTQTWLAGEMGVSRARVSHIFSAPPNFTFESLARLALALNLTPKVILDWDGFLGGHAVRDHRDAEDWVTDQAYAAAHATGVIPFKLNGAADASS